jgi:hypothetical protein
VLPQWCCGEETATSNYRATTVSEAEDFDLCRIASRQTDEASSEFTMTRDIRLLT